MANAQWGMVVDMDKCTGCQACVVACQSENNVPINEEAHFNQRRAIEWIRIERYWEGEFPNVKARFIRCSASSAAMRHASRCVRCMRHTTTARG